MSNRHDPRRQHGDAAADGTAALRAALGGRSLVLVGLMGCGKTSVGRRLAQRLGLPFVDADDAIEQAAGMTIPEIFAAHGEPYFRDGERRVIARLLREGQKVLATGGGAFMNEETRANVAQAGVSIWLRGELPLLLKRVMRRDNRPLLKTADPAATMQRLMDQRHPIYALADVTIKSRDVPHEIIVGEVVEALAAMLGVTPPGGSGTPPDADPTSASP
jgi:shikimate kinase